MNLRVQSRSVQVNYPPAVPITLPHKSPVAAMAGLEGDHSYVGSDPVNAHVLRGYIQIRRLRPARILFGMFKKFSPSHFELEPLEALGARGSGSIGKEGGGLRIPAAPKYGPVQIVPFGLLTYASDS